MDATGQTLSPPSARTLEPESAWSRDGHPAWAAAALDALSTHILVLDAAGTILAVNQGWREFAAGNGLTLPDAGVGSSYLAVCGEAAEDGPPESHAAATGIGSVLSGQRGSFTQEYPCPWGGRERWYLLRVTPIEGAPPAAVLVSHEEITGRKLAELNLVRSQEELESRVTERTAELARSEELHRHIIESLPGGVYHIASDGSFVGANNEGLRFLGMSMEDLRRRIIPDFGNDTFHEDGTHCPVEDYAATRCLATGQPQGPTTIGLRRPDGSVGWAVFTAVPVPCPVHPGAPARW